MKGYPLFFTPDLKERIWGGEKISKVYNKSCDCNNIGESWEIASHKNGESIVRNGELKGLTLSEAICKNKKIMLGESLTYCSKFTLLLKIIDANDKLSVQVHPKDEYAYKNENGELGKNEAWYILQADEGAELIAGLKKGVNKEEFKKAVQEGTLKDVMNTIKVQAGDVIDIPAGLVHAIGEGIVIAEIQQNSDTTYRVYDWDRKDEDGNGRELHIEKAIDVIDFSGQISTDVVKGTQSFNNDNKITSYINNHYFTLEKIEIKNIYEVQNKGNEFELYMCIENDGYIKWDNEEHFIENGDSFLLPASLENFKIEGYLTLLKMKNNTKYEEKNKKSVVVGIDGGGTSTRITFMGLNGELLSCGEGGPSSVDTVDENVTANSINNAYLQCCKSLGYEPNIEVIAIGIGGLASKKDALLVEQILNTLSWAKSKKIIAVNDSTIALEGAIDGNEGLCLIIGTGSVCLGKNAKNETHKAGGWGYKFDDYGSGYDLGRQSLKVMAKTYDGRMEDNKIAHEVFNFLGLQSIDEIPEKLYKNDFTRTDIASLAKIVMENYIKGDEIAVEIVDECIEELTNTIKAVYNNISFENDTVPIATIGGLTSSYPGYVKVLENRVSKEIKALKFVKPKEEPVIGACLLALKYYKNLNLK